MFEDSNNTLTVSPNGHSYWIPDCPDESKPRIEMIFETIDKGLEFYEEYARVSGFVARRATSKRAADGSLTHRIIVCNKEGNHKKSDSCKYERDRLTTRCGCKAECRFTRIDGGRFKIYKFEEMHNHQLASQVSKQIASVNRKLSFDEQNFLVQCGKVRIGAAKAHRLMKERAGEGEGGRLPEHFNYEVSVQEF